MEPEQFGDRDRHADHSSASFQHVASAAHEVLKITSTRGAFSVNPVQFRSMRRGDQRGRTLGHHCSSSRLGSNFTKRILYYQWK